MQEGQAKEKLCVPSLQYNYTQKIFFEQILEFHAENKFFFYVIYAPEVWLQNSA